MVKVYRAERCKLLDSLLLSLVRHPRADVAAVVEHLDDEVLADQGDDVLAGGRDLQHPDRVVVLASLFPVVWHVRALLAGRVFLLRGYSQVIKDARLDLSHVALVRPVQLVVRDAGELLVAVGGGMLARELLEEPRDRPESIPMLRLRVVEPGEAALVISLQRF